MFALIFHKFWQRYTNRLAFTVILVFAVLALIAPLLANDKPLWLNEKDSLTFPAVCDYVSDIESFQKLCPHRSYNRFTEHGVWPLIPYGPTQVNLDHILQAPSGLHLLGTDDQGRDVASRLIHGARTSLTIGFVAIIIIFIIGLTLGALAGLKKGLWDAVISRLIDVMMCFPTFLLIISLLGLVGSGSDKIILVIGLTGWTTIARLVRGEILKIRSLEYMIAGEALGYSTGRLIFFHALPNVISPVISTLSFGLAGAIIIETSLSFLGFGVPPPQASWGEILNQSRTYMDVAWWLLAFPGLSLLIMMLSLTVVGEGLRDTVEHDF